MLLPEFCLSRRLDAVGVIGSALSASGGGRGVRAIARRLGLPPSTVGDWIRAFRRNGAPWPPDRGASSSAWAAAAVATDGLLLAPAVTNTQRAGATRTRA